MQKKISIIISLIIFILLIGTCVFNIEEEKPPLISITEPERMEFYHDSCIVILNKNWDPGKLDSVLSIINHRNTIYYPDADLLVFISINKDTINYNRSQINSANPLIIFTPEGGPILCTANRFPQLYEYYFPETDNYLDISHQSGDDILIEEPTTAKDRKKWDDLSTLERISSIKFEIKNICEKLPLIEKTSLRNRNLSYPILNYNQFLSIRFDNDFWDYTDYYYTNGIAVSYSHPVFTSSPISRLLISNGNSGIDYYGLKFIQHMYTGLKPKVDSIIPGDRPWSAYSTIGQYLISYDIINKIKHYSEFNIGLLGPESGGGFLQNFVHVILPNNSPPQGWENQIATDVLIDYQYTIDKYFYASKSFESYIRASGQIGTLRDNLSWGFGFRYGKFLPFYQDMSIYHYKRMNAPFEKTFRYNLVFNIETNLIGYDATLQGGFINKESIYVLPSVAINRFTLEAYAGFEVSYGQWELQFLQFWKSREFHTGQDHKYASVRLNIAF